MDIPILYEDDDIIAVNKPAGLLTHKDAHNSSEPTLVDWILKKYPDVKEVGDNPKLRPGIVHRLDKFTSGVIVIAKTNEAFNHLKKQFQSRQIKKTYLALVRGVVKNDKGVIEKPIGLKPGTVKRTVWTKKAKMVKEAKTEYKVKKRFAQATLLEVTPLTGRTHQIRVHLASIHHPIVGDYLYGKRQDEDKKLNVNRLFLHAYSLELKTPSGKNLKITADPPEELTSILEQLSREDRQETK